MKKLLVLLLLMSFSLPSIARGRDIELPFAKRDTCTLSMDVYMPDDSLSEHPCMIFVYGGGFMHQNQRTKKVEQFCRHLADLGYVAIATDYRLGLKGITAKSTLGMIKPTENAIKMASEDLFSAVEYVLLHHDKLKIDRSRIFISGSSAGAITVLQTDYELANRTSLASAMPRDFRFAGVIAFSGAVFSREGKCDYRVHKPSPTLMFHGTADKLVTYDKIQIFNTGFFGSNQLAKRFKTYDATYGIIRFDNHSHEVAEYFNKCFDEMMRFIDNVCNTGAHYQFDIYFTDQDYDASKGMTVSTKDYYK